MSIKIKPSKRNTNKHTDKGMNLLENSIDNYGVLESISVTEEGTIISGHARKELFDKKGMIAKEIKLADNEYPVILTNIKDDTKEYYEAQIMANTTAHHNYNLDTTEIEVIAMEYDLEIEELGVEIEELVMDGVEPENSKPETDNFIEKEQKYFIKLEYNETDCDKVKDALSKISQRPEQAIFELLGLS